MASCFLCRDLLQTNSETSFHRFPVDAVTRKTWFSICGIVKGTDVSHIRICSKHFNADDFCDQTQRMLKKEAVPVKYPFHNTQPLQAGINTTARAASAISGHRPVCFVCRQPSNPNSRISLHKFPTDPSTRKTWFTFCGFLEGDDVSNIRICSNHFRPIDFCNPNAPIRSKLRRGAVPSTSVSRAQTITTAGMISGQIIHSPKRQKLDTSRLIPVTITKSVMDNIVLMDVNRRKSGAHTRLLPSRLTSTSVLSDQNIERQPKLEHADNWNPPGSTVATSTFPDALDNFVDMDELKPLINQGISNSDSVDPLRNSGDMNTSASAEPLYNLVDIKEEPLDYPEISDPYSEDPLDDLVDMNDVKPPIYPEKSASSSADSSHYFLGVKELEFHDYAKDIRTLVSPLASSNSVMESIKNEEPQQMETSVFCTEYENIKIKTEEEEEEEECDHLETSPKTASEMNLITTVKCESLLDQSTETTPQTTSYPIKSYENSSSQTTWVYKDVLMLREENARLKRESTNMRKELSQVESSRKYQTVTAFVDSLRGNKKKCKFYTSLYFEQIQDLFEFLSPIDEMIYWGSNKPSTGLGMKKLKPFEELVMTLVRLRTGLLVQDMAFRFNISTGLITKSVNTWILHASKKFNFMRFDMATSRETIENNLPPAFKWSKDITVTIECAKFVGENVVSSNLSCSKGQTTFKVLLGYNPDGAICFISELFLGSLSNKEIMEKSNIPHLIQTGDIVLANSKNDSLEILPEEEKNEAAEAVEINNIDEENIHGEHVIGTVARLKEFKLMQKVLPLSMRGILSEAIFVCACLLNFQEPVSKKNEN